MSFKKEIEFLENNPHNIFVVSHGNISSKKSTKESLTIEHRVSIDSKKINIKINKEAFEITDNAQKEDEYVFCAESSSYCLNDNYSLDLRSIEVNNINLNSKDGDSKNTIQPSLNYFLNTIYDFIELHKNISKINYSIDDKNKDFENKEITLNALINSVKKSKEDFPIQESCIFDPNILEVDHVTKRILSNLNEMLFNDSLDDKYGILNKTIIDLNGLKNIMSIYVKDGFLDEIFIDLKKQIKNVSQNISHSIDSEVVNSYTIELIKQIKETEKLFQKEHHSYYSKYKEIETLEKHLESIIEENKIEEQKELQLRKSQSFKTIVVPDVFLIDNKTLKQTLKEYDINYNKFSELNKALNLSKNPIALINKLKKLSTEAQIETVYYINNVNSSSKIKNLLAGKKKKSDVKSSIDRGKM
jgi:hypothetical protein